MRNVTPRDLHQHFDRILCDREARTELFNRRNPQACPRQQTPPTSHIMKELYPNHFPYTGEQKSLEICSHEKKEQTDVLSPYFNITLGKRSRL